MTAPEWTAIMVLVAVAELLWLAGEAIVRSLRRMLDLDMDIRAGMARGASTAGRHSVEAPPAPALPSTVGAGLVPADGQSAERGLGTWPLPAPSFSGAGPQTPVSVGTPDPALTGLTAVGYAEGAAARSEAHAAAAPTRDAA